jgi:molybdopterin synthase sulfur carrier subunit
MESQKRGISMIKVLLFAQLKDEMGKETISIEGNGLSVAQLKEKIRAEFQLEGLDTVMTAVNEEFAGDEVIVADGDTIAFIPPVSGG